MPSPPMLRPPPRRLRAKPPATGEKVIVPAARKTIAVRATRMSKERSWMRDIGNLRQGADLLPRNSPIPPVRNIPAATSRCARTVKLLGRLRTDEAHGRLVLQLLHRACELFLRHAGHRETDRVDPTAAGTVHDRDLVVLEQLVHVASRRFGSEADQRIRAALDRLIGLHRGGLEAAALPLAHEHPG